MSLLSYNMLYLRVENKQPNWEKYLDIIVLQLHDLLFEIL
jgi:hypothetical protein